MVKHLALGLLTLLVLSSSVTAQRRNSGQVNTSGGVLLPEQAAFDVLTYSLALRVDPQSRSIQGRLDMTARLVEDTKEIVLDLDQRLTVDQAFTYRPGSDLTQPWGGTHREGRIRIPVPTYSKGELLGVSVHYAGQPREARNPPWDGGFTWAVTQDGRPWIATSCQGEGADLWWPCKDHPSDEPDSFDLLVAVPEPLVAASNGRLVEVREGGIALPDSRPDGLEGWRTFHWQVTTPINNYGVAVCIAPYETITTRIESVAGDSFDFTFWTLPQSRAKAEAALPEFVGAIKVLEELCGPYPFRADKAGVAETPFLGMEHQTLIAYGAGYRGDPDLGYDYDWLFQHELSHEWWGNLVTARDWKDFWIHEGIGTYMQALYLERRFGPEAYRKKMLFDLERVQNRGTVAPREPRTTQEMYFASRRPDAPDIDVYMKGAWICHTLRWLLGDETFFEVLRRWAYPDPALEATSDGSACRFVDSQELLSIAEERSGVELDWFFELYLRQPALPRLVTERRGQTLHLRWETPGGLPFPMPVEVQIGQKRVRVEMPKGRGELGVGAEEPRLDPHAWLLMARD